MDNGSNSTNNGHSSGSSEPDLCRVCGKGIRAMVFRGTGFCSENCRKRNRGEQPAEQPEWHPYG